LSSFASRRLALVALVALATACAPVVPRPAPAEPAGAPFRAGSFADASAALSIRVPRPAWLPPGARLDALEYSTDPTSPWVVQRYRLPQGVVYLLAELVPPGGIQAEVAARLTIQGRPGILSPRWREDGGIAEWRVLWQRGAVLYTVGGEATAEQLVEIASHLR
jgi:hypothetical protein